MDSGEIEKLRYQRNMRLSVEERLDQATINPIRPGIDDQGVSGRVFDTMTDYKRWCATLPKWLGYGPAGDEENEVESESN